MSVSALDVLSSLEFKDLFTTVVTELNRDMSNEELTGFINDIYPKYSALRTKMNCGGVRKGITHPSGKLTLTYSVRNEVWVAVYSGDEDEPDEVALLDAGGPYPEGEIVQDVTLENFYHAAYQLLEQLHNEVDQIVLRRAERVGEALLTLKDHTMIVEPGTKTPDPWPKQNVLYQLKILNAYCNLNTLTQAKLLEQVANQNHLRREVLDAESIITAVTQATS